MNNAAPSIILFGTGSGGRNGYHHLKKTHRIIGFCDNSKAKQGKQFCGLPTVSPEGLKALAFDRIVICSMYKDEIRDQLTMKLNIPYEIIDLLDPDVRVYGSGKPLVCILMLATAIMVIGFIALVMLS